MTITIEWATETKTFNRTYTEAEIDLARALDRDLTDNEDVIWISSNYPGQGRKTWIRTETGGWQIRR